VRFAQPASASAAEMHVETDTELLQEASLLHVALTRELHAAEGVLVSELLQATKATDIKRTAKA